MLKNNSCLLFFLFTLFFCIPAIAQTQKFNISQQEIDDYNNMGKLETVGSWICAGCDSEQKAYRQAVAEAAKKQNAQIVFNATDASLNAAISDPIQKLKDAASKYTKGLQSTATSLFWLLVAITFSYQFGFMVLKRSDVGEFFAEFVKFSITIGFFYWLLINGSTIALAIFDGLSVKVALKDGGFAADPLNIVQAGFKILSLCSDASSVSASSPSTWVIYFWKLTAGLVCLFFLTLLAINFAILKATGYLVLYLGVIVLGFGGSPYTRDWTLTYFRNAISLGIRLLIMTLIIAVGIALIIAMAENESNLAGEAIGKDLGLLNAILLLLSVVLLFKVAETVPNIISSFIGNAGAAPSGVGVGAAALTGMAAAPVAMAMTGAKMYGAMKAGNLTMGNVGSALMAAMTSGSNAAQAFSKSIGNSISSNQSKKENAQKENADKAFKSELLDAIKGGNGEGGKK